MATGVESILQARNKNHLNRDNHPTWLAFSFIWVLMSTQQAFTFEPSLFLPYRAVVCLFYVGPRETNLGLHSWQQVSN